MRKLLLLLFGVVFFAVQAMAQRTITGKVTDEKGQPVPNASVVVKGTTAGVTTKADGTFSLTVPANGTVLVISSVDMLTQEMNMAGGTNFSIALKGEDKIMQEIVVVGYGTQQKKAFTGSTSKVPGEDIANLISPSVDKQLAGRAPGVQVTNVGGLVNQPARILIRGFNSLSQGTGPLFVVDGVPILSGNLANTTNSNQLADINPADIETIDVLKDGASTAIYGSRAAGGVVMITTKKGTKGKFRVNYDAAIGFSSTLKRFDLLNADQFVAISNEKFANSGVAPRAGVNPGGTNTDWQSVAFIENALVQNHNISFQGGGPRTTFFFSLNYSKQQGVVRSNYNQLMRGRFNLEHEVNNFIKIGNNMSVTRQVNTDQNNGSNSLSGSIASTLRLLPNVSPYNNLHPTGYNISFPAANSIPVGANSASVDDNFTNVAFTVNTNKFSSETYRIINNAFLELSFTKKLKFRSQMQGDWFNDYGFQGLDPRHGDGFSSNGIAFNSAQNILRYTWQNFINYNLNIKKHNFFLTAGHEVQNTVSKIVSAQGASLSDFFFIKENLITNAASTQSVGGGFAKAGIESYFARFNYDYKNKYFFQATMRRDGQSSLGDGNKYGNFPGVSFGWRLSEERGWKENKFLSKWFSDVKVKYSYARVGNPIGGFPYLTSTYGPSLYGGINAISLNFIGNPNIKWEASSKHDLGIEMSMFNGRANLSIDWFKNDITDLILAVPTPISAGVPGNNIQQNVGTTENKGIEIALNLSVIRKKDFGWDLNFNYSNVKNRVTKLFDINGAPTPLIQQGNYNIYRVGDPANIIYGFESAGVNTANGFPMYRKGDGRLVVQSSLNGRFYFINDANDGSLLTANETTLSTLTDRKVLGQGIPTYFGALTNTFRYKQFEMEVMFRYSGGNQIMNVTRQEALLSNSFHNNGVEILQRWTKPGDVTNVPRVYWGQSNRINFNGQAISRFVEDGDYIRLQNIILSYTMDKELVNRIFKGGVSNLRFFLQGQNLGVWTDYTGADPDNISVGGVDNGVSPQIRTISFGLSLGF